MQQDTFVKERTALAVQPEQGEDTIDLLELFMGLLAHWTLIAACLLYTSPSPRDA